MKMVQEKRLLIISKQKLRSFCKKIENDISMGLSPWNENPCSINVK